MTRRPAACHAALASSQRGGLARSGRPHQAGHDAAAQAQMPGRLDLFGADALAAVVERRLPRLRTSAASTASVLWLVARRRAGRARRSSSGAAGVALGARGRSADRLPVHAPSSRREVPFARHSAQPQQALDVTRGSRHGDRVGVVAHARRRASTRRSRSAGSDRATDRVWRSTSASRFQRDHDDRVSRRVAQHRVDERSDVVHGLDGATVSLLRADVDGPVSSGVAAQPPASPRHRSRSTAGAGRPACRRGSPGWPAARAAAAPLVTALGHGCAGIRSSSAQGRGDGAAAAWRSGRRAASGIPASSRTGRASRRPSSRGVNRTPRRARSSSSSRVLYRSEAATADRVEGLAVQRQPPRRAVRPVKTRPDLVRHRDVGVQVRVAGSGLEVVERSGDQPVGVDLEPPACDRCG